MVDVEYLYGADSELAAARLRCRLSRGTFPHVSWFFNDDPLPPEVHEDAHNHSRPASSSMYATADQSRTLFLTQLGPKESGYYRCKVRDNYDAAGAWVESAAVLVQVTGEEPVATRLLTSNSFVLNCSFNDASRVPLNVPKCPCLDIFFFNN